MIHGTWGTAQSIADLNLPGIPHTKNGVIIRAKRMKWPYRPHRGHGKGREYPLSTVLMEVQADGITPEAKDSLIIMIDKLEASHKATEEVLERLRRLIKGLRC